MSTDDSPIGGTVSEAKSIKVHCNNCGPQKNHLVLHSADTRWEAEQGLVEGGIYYEMLKCAGCEKVVLRETEWCSETPGESEVRFYPPATFRPAPKWLAEFYLEFPSGQDLLHDLLKEVYVALQNDQPYLAAMGIRALVEQIMINKVGDNGSFTKNLDAFQNGGYVSALQREQLETVLEAGHASIHRGYKPTEEDLMTIVDLTEVLVQTIYLHGSKVKELKGKIPPRK